MNVISINFRDYSARHRSGLCSGTRQTNVTKKLNYTCSKALSEVRCPFPIN